ncbi:MAG: extracellular solute-binding protein [Maribacter sp.]|nr:extracellular solute-binding protein [Maribacter sp.]
MEIYLKGMAWDHPRGYEPLRALSNEYMKIHPEVNIKWEIRSLKEFGDMPIEDLIEEYDVITIDHPYMGQAHRNKLLLDLKGFITNGRFAYLENAYVDHCFDSYVYENHLYALPIDAAALVAAKRNDLFLELGLTSPTTHKELKRFYKKVPNGYTVAWPLCPTDMWCSFLTLCAQEGGLDFIQNYEIDKSIGIRVIDQLKFHLEFLHPHSINWNPIQVLDYMAEKEEIIYAPYLFGYTNYSRNGYAKNIVTFLDSPNNPEIEVSTILGGVGLAVSTNCKQKEMAVDLVEYIADPHNQAGSYVQHQGQPAGILAWQSDTNNALCNDFFKNTTTTMQNAYVRPQHVAWNEFQEQGADLTHEGVANNTGGEVLINDLNALYKSIVYNE